MAVSKVVYGDDTLIDLTSDTVTADTLASGVTAHSADGQLVTGTMSSGGCVVVLDSSQVSADGTPSVADPSNDVMYLTPDGDSYKQWVYSGTTTVETYPYDLFSAMTYSEVSTVDDTIWTSRQRGNSGTDLAVYCWSTDDPSTYPVGQVISTPYNKISSLKSTNTLMYMTGDYLSAQEFIDGGGSIGSSWLVYKREHKKGDVMSTSSSSEGWVQVGTTKSYVDESVWTTDTRTATLTSSGWSSLQQTVSVSGVTASSNIIVSPAPSSVEEWGKAGVYASAQASGSVTFKCKKAPTSNLTANMMILK